jgi:hypothetical protein
MLNLYPRRFKDEFGDEMHNVFRNSVEDAAEEGTFALVHVCGKEFMGMPFNILKEFWHEIQGEDARMQSTPFAPWEPGSWGDSVWAGLPHLLIAILFAVTAALANTSLATISGIVLALLWLGGFLATIYYTWRNRWPVCSASWYGYIGLIILLFSILPSQGWAPPAEGIFVTIRFLLLPLCLAALLYWLTRSNPVEALLMAMPVMIVYWLPVMEFIPKQIRNWLIFGIFIISTLTAITITRINTIRAAIWIVLGASVLGGLPISYARTYWQDIPFPYTPTIAQMAELFSVQWLASIALVIGPILGWGIWNLGKRDGRDGRIAARLIILGTLVNLWGQFRYWQGFSHQNFFDAFRFPLLQASGQAWPAYTAYAGLIATLVGAILLAIQVWTDSKPLSISLIILPLVWPLFAMFPIYFGYHIIPAGLSFEFGELSQTFRLLIFFASGLLVIAGGWAVTRLYSNPIRAGAA